MVSTGIKFSLFLLFACFIRGTIEAVICDKLPKKLCSFAVSSDGKRCILDDFDDEDENFGSVCKTSEITVEKVYGHIETNECVAACGLTRETFGVSSDALLSQEFTSHLCSSACYHNCPNIVDLYLKLAAGEGVSLPTFCEKLKDSPNGAVPVLMSRIAAAIATN